MAWFQAQPAFQFKKSQTALLVTAHPDDEVMFFSPLLEWIRISAGRIHILCLSTGNFEGMGFVRRDELLKCAYLYGIPNENVEIVDNSQLQDGLEKVWPVGVVSDIVTQHIAKLGNIDLVRYYAIWKNDD